MDSAQNSNNSKISIQVSLNGYSFTCSGAAGCHRSAWLGADKIFTTRQFQLQYDEVEISLMTPKCALVPSRFVGQSSNLWEVLSRTVDLGKDDFVQCVEIPQFSAVLVYSNSMGETLSRAISQTVSSSDGRKAEVLPELFFLLEYITCCSEYNKIVASWCDGYLFLVVAQGNSLQLANVYKAPDFVTAQYYIFLVMKTLQLNPEVSTICWRTPLSVEEEMSLYRYFKAVEQI